MCTKICTDWLFEPQAWCINKTGFSSIRIHHCFEMKTRHSVYCLLLCRSDLSRNLQVFIVLVHEISHVQGPQEIAVLAWCVHVKGAWYLIGIPNFNQTVDIWSCEFKVSESYCEVWQAEWFQSGLWSLWREQRNALECIGHWSLVTRLWSRTLPSCLSREHRLLDSFLDLSSWPSQATNGRSTGS